MSVLNQMLKDLSARGAAPPAPADSLAAGAQPERLAPLMSARRAAPRRDLLRTGVWTLTGGMVVIGAAALWWQSRAETAVRVPQPLGSRQFGAALAGGEMNVKAPAVLAAAGAPLPVDAVVAAPTAPAAPMATALATPPRAEPAPVEPRAAPRPAHAPGKARAPVAAPATAPAPAAPGSEATVTRSAASQNDPNADVARAADLIARGRHTDAMALLAGVLARDPAHGNARAALAALQAEAGRRDAAAATLLDGAAIDPARFAIPAAQLQSELGAPEAALATLARVPAERRSGAYHALAGGIALRAQRPADAVDAYGRALADPEPNAMWWIGLGLALEAIGRHAEAREAYARLYQAPALDADVREFLTEKLASLAAASAPARRADRDGRADLARSQQP